MWLFIAFLAVPLIEIGLFIQVGGLIGLWPTLLIVVLTAIAGTALVRGQGLQAVARLKRSMSELSDPSRALADGAMILFAGALLLTPGFFTDIVGFALLTPPVRLAAMRYAKKHVKVSRAGMGPGPGDPFGARPGQGGPHGPRRDGSRGRPDVIDAEYEEVTPQSKRPTHQGSGWTKH